MSLPIKYAEWELNHDKSHIANIGPFTLRATDDDWSIAIERFVFMAGPARYREGAQAAAEKAFRKIIHGCIDWSEVKS